MKTKVLLHFFETDEKMPKKKIALLKNTIKKHACAAGLILDIPLVNISIYCNSDFAIPETGESGRTLSKGQIQIFIDATEKKIKLDKIIKNIIPSTVYHEMNHVARWRSAGYGKTLDEALISEGLAVVFAQEQWKAFRAPWAKASEKEIRNFLKIFREAKGENHIAYDHDEWFFGTGRFPRWCGYKLGAHIARTARRNNRKLEWKDLMKKSADEIVKSGLGKRPNAF